MYFDPMYFLFIAPALVLSLWASASVRRNFKKYSRVAVATGLSGAEAAQRLLDGAGLSDVAIERSKFGQLSDHYNPVSRSLHLSDAVYGSRSVAAIGVACHEAGHAIQHARAYRPMWLRSALVQERTLARFAVELGMGEVLRLGRGEAEGGGRERPANLEDAFEALMGALYLDGGLEPVWRLLYPLVEPVAAAILDADADRDSKSQLQEWAQAELGVTPSYRIVAERGPDHAKTFVAEVLLGPEVAGRGEGHSKQSAERAAAQQAMEART